MENNTNVQVTKEFNQSLSVERKTNNIPHEQYCLLNLLPLAVLKYISTYLYDSHALSFGECVTNDVLRSEPGFWKSLGRYKNAKYTIISNLPRETYYDIEPDYFIQRSSNRKYARFVYYAFFPKNLGKLTKYCNSDSFRTFVRLHSYSTHFAASIMPIFNFLDYPIMCKYRSLNLFETKLFRIFRTGHLGDDSIIVQNIQEFETNLDNRFSYYLIKQWINFSHFILAGGIVLNALLINGFESIDQDFDFFWLGGSWQTFILYINEFECRAKPYIIGERNLYGKVIEFILCFNNQHKIRIQFVFGRNDTNAAFILNTFDIDVVQVGYDGSKIVSTLGFCQAIATRTFICYKLTNDIRDVHIYIDRCIKYNARGFTWLCPIEYDDIIAQKPVICERKIVDYGFNEFYYNVDPFNVQMHFLDLN